MRLEAFATHCRTEEEGQQPSPALQTAELSQLQCFSFACFPLKPSPVCNCFLILSNNPRHYNYLSYSNSMNKYLLNTECRLPLLLESILDCMCSSLWQRRHKWSSENKHLKNSGTATSHSGDFGDLPCPFSLLTTSLCSKTFPFRLLQSKCGCLSVTKATECQREQESGLCPIISSPESASLSHLLTGH